MTPTLPDDHDFASASRAVLEFLHARFAFDLWMVTRTEGNDWIVLQSLDRGYGVETGAVFNWLDSFCSRMVEGLGPRIAPASNSVPSYAAAPIAQALKIGAYVGVPLTNGEGVLFGTLCAIHPTPQPEAIAQDLPMIEILASMLSSVLRTELKATEATRRAEHAHKASETDEMTGLFNRRGWNRLLETEEIRCRRYGHPACVIAIDLNGLKTVNDSQGHAAGDQLICRAAETLQSAIRDSDVVARLGGDEFAVLAVECTHESARELGQRIAAALRDAGLSASWGLAMRRSQGGLSQAATEADHEMYRHKELSRSAL